MGPMETTRRTESVGMGLLLALLGAAVITGAARGQAETQATATRKPGAAKVGARIPAFTAKALNGKAVEVSRAKGKLSVKYGTKEEAGKPLLLIFWGCPS